jgi:hypothetical protein
VYYVCTRDAATLLSSLLNFTSPNAATNKLFEWGTDVSEETTASTFRTKIYKTLSDDLNETVGFSENLPNYLNMIIEALRSSESL